MGNFVAYQDVECVFPMSGQYGRAPRALYYFLLLFVVVLRRQDWLTAGAAAACLTYGGSAAIHALILTPVLSLGTTSIPDGVVELPNSTRVHVQALASDLDSDATLAIVGSGFLIVIPMAIWSAHFKHSGAAPVLFLWILLMFIGMIGCMTNLYAIDGTADGPLRQFRFCSLDYSDALPYSRHPIDTSNGPWNETIWSYFVDQNSLLPSCIYPCLNAKQLLRQQGDAQVINFLDINPSTRGYWVMHLTTAVIYGCVPLSILLSLALLVLRLRGYTSSGWNLDSAFSRGWRERFAHYALWTINIYGKILTPFVFVMFLGWVEWIISYDLQAEPMQSVGQWAPLVGAMLVLIAAVVGRYWGQVPRAWRAYWRRRTTAKAESVGQSVLYVWKREREFDSRSTWSREGGFTFLQGSDQA